MVEMLVPLFPEMTNRALAKLLETDHTVVGKWRKAPKELDIKKLDRYLLSLFWVNSKVIKIKRNYKKGFKMKIGIGVKMKNIISGKTFEEAEQALYELKQH